MAYVDISSPAIDTRTAVGYSWEQEPFSTATSGSGRQLEGRTARRAIACANRQSSFRRICKPRPYRTALPSAESCPYFLATSRRRPCLLNDAATYHACLGRWSCPRKSTKPSCESLYHAGSRTMSAVSTFPNSRIGLAFEDKAFYQHVGRLQQRPTTYVY